MVLTIKNFSNPVGPGIVAPAPTNLVGVAGTRKATLTWTSATGESGVLWTEEKLVRKEGSAPAGSMDGDVVTTITTKDTYSTTGYEDTELYSTKTYYYKVFAIYDNGTEVGSSAVNVTPAGWTPGANTYCYLPLVDDYADHSGNSVAVTSDITSYDTNMFPGGTGKYIHVPQNNIIVSGENWTILFWIYARNKNDSNVTVVAETANWNSGNFSRQVDIEFVSNANAFPSSMGYTENAGGAYDAWHLFGLSHEANGYIKGAWDGQPFTGTKTGDNVNFPLYFGRHVIQTNRMYGLLGQLKDIVIETKARSDQEFEDYYLSTKGNYGL